MPHSPRLSLSDTPHQLTVEVNLRAVPLAIYEAWTERFDLWFAEPDSLRMRAEVGEPFYFAVHHEGVHRAHYGRFLTLTPPRHVELTWVTGEGGTGGAETVVSVTLAAARDGGTSLRLTHTGFSDAAARARHEEAWPNVLAHLDQCLTRETRH